MRKFLAAVALFSSLMLTGAGAALGGELSVTKAPWCGCCNAWIDHMKAAGYDVDVHEMDDLSALKVRLGIAPKHQSCHTGEIEGYVIEGHVPAADVERLLAERPDAIGLSVPGMPVGSPGMEMGDRKDAYDVLLIKKDGSTEVFSRQNQSVHNH